MRSRPGIAIMLALVVLLVVEAMTACMLALATQARLAGASDVRTGRADAAAQLALQQALASANRSRFDTLAAGTLVPIVSDAEADATWSATIERLPSGLFVIRARAQVGGPVTFSSARGLAVARLLDRDAVLVELNGALIGAASTVIAGATDISADAAALPPAWADSLCPAVPPLSTPASLLTAAPAIVSGAATISGPIVVDTLLARADSTALSAVSWGDIESIADRVESGTLTPVPRADSIGCDAGASANWGDPLHPDAVCGSYFPLIFARGDVRVDGGTGQGILVVDGTLTLTAGASFAGVIVARDGLIVEPGSSVYGAARSKGATTLVDDARLVYSRCAIARSLAETAAARRLIRQRRTFLPAF